MFAQIFFIIYKIYNNYLQIGFQVVFLLKQQRFLIYLQREQRHILRFVL